MRLTVLFILCTGLCWAADANSNDEAFKEAVKKEKEKLQGTWKVVSIEEDGRKQTLPEGSKMQIIFSEDALVVRISAGKNSEVKAAEYTIDPTKKPAYLDLTPDEEDAKPIPYIYALDKDELKLCGAAEGNQDRPRELASKRGQKTVLLILKREKK